MRKLAILGASGHGRVAAETAEKLGWHVSFYDARYPQLTTSGPYQVVGNEQQLQDRLAELDGVFIAIGNNGVRKAKQLSLTSAGAKIVSLISVDAVVSQHASIGAGVLVVAGACINTGSHIADGVIVNTRALVDHDCVIAEFSHICPGVSLAGNVGVGSLTWVGIGSVVIQGITIGQESIIGAGTVVIRDIDSHVTAVGNPARVL